MAAARISLGTRNIRHESEPGGGRVLLFCESGGLSISFDRVRIRAAAGNLVLLPEGGSPAVLDAPAGSAEAIAVRFVPRPGWERRLNAWTAAGQGVRLCLVSDPAAIERLRATFGYLLEDAAALNDPISRELAMNDLGEIVFIGAQSLARQSAASDISEAIRKALDWIIDHLAEPIRIADISKVAGLSPALFTARFRQETGMPVLPHILHQRLGRAENYLLSTDMSIAKIARRTGFNSAAYFTRMFRRAYGASPREYQRREGDKCLKSKV
ncbi:MAG: helix-turn-helix domain-containing protein [Planctomycetota bacterium]